MYIFNRITVNPQLPKRIEKLSEIANNLWWSWNTEFLRLFQKIDKDLWEQSSKNPVKFLKHVDQERLEKVAKETAFLKEYDKIVENFEGYMNSKNTWFSSKYSSNKNDLIAYFSAEYGLDQTIPIYSGGLRNFIWRSFKISKRFRNSISSSRTIIQKWILPSKNQWIWTTRNRI